MLAITNITLGKARQEWEQWKKYVPHFHLIIKAYKVETIPDTKC